VAFLCNIKLKVHVLVPGVIIAVDYGRSVGTWEKLMRVIYMVFFRQKQSLIYPYCYLHNNFITKFGLPLTLWVRNPLRRGVLDTISCDKVCQWLAAGRWFSPGTPLSSNNKTDRHDITEIMLKVALNTITLTLLPTSETVFRKNIIWTHSIVSSCS
jgi:hypothetical protein